MGRPTRFLAWAPWLPLLIAANTLPRAASSSAIDAKSNIFLRATPGPGYINIPVVNVNQSSHNPRLTGRDLVTVELENRELYYAVSLWLGTPAQEVVVNIDTGSSELWVNPNCTTAAGTRQGQCGNDGAYKAERSTTPPKGPEAGDTISYTDGSFADLEYWDDRLSLGGDAVIPYQRFGVATDSDFMDIGIFGIGPNLLTGFAKHEPYHVIDSLVEEGITNSRAYSLDLRHYDDPTGTILYGGLDRGRFTGPLEKCPVVLASDGFNRLSVMMSEIGVTNPSSSDSTSYPLTSKTGNILLDSGATMSYLYTSTALPILADMGAEEENGIYWVPCTLRDAPPSSSGGTVDFKFGSTMIKVPFSDIIRDISVVTGDSGGRCPVGIVPIPDERSQLQILGTTFLRAAYVVVDWDNGNVHLAQGASCRVEEIVAIGKGEDTVPEDARTGLCSEADAPTAVSESGTGGDSDDGDNGAEGDAEAALAEDGDEGDESGGSLYGPGMVGVLVPLVISLFVLPTL